MIRVMRPDVAPAVLMTEGIPKAQEHCDAYDGGARDFQFDPMIYGHPTVKQLLVDMHHGKCCYCESKVRHTAPGTIDHYRPKAASQQQVGDPLIRPGYYWLAYQWENLLFECSACNQQNKRNLFPLANNTQRALSHLDSINQEQPLLIDPSQENPAEFISFREEYAFALNGNIRGRATIEILGLNDRNDLVERRRDILKILRLLRDVIFLLPQSRVAADAQLVLNEAVLETAEYTAMSRVLLQ